VLYTSLLRHNYLEYAARYRELMQLCLALFSVLISQKFLIVMTYNLLCVENAQVMVLAATNRPSELDEAILRRLPQAFEIGIPDQRERADILKVILKGERVEENIDFDHIAYLCEGYTGSDLFDLCKKAAYFPIRELLDEEKKGRSFSVSDSSLSSFSFTYLNIFIFVTLGTMISRAEMSGMHIHI